MMRYGGISVRALEVVLASYFGLVGAYFLSDPNALAAPVYAQWSALGGTFWGIAMVVIASVHLFALWVNGAAPSVSKPLRIFAGVLHLGTALQFARMFIDGGAPWGAITYLGLVAPIAVLVCIPQARRWAAHGEP